MQENLEILGNKYDVDFRFSNMRNGDEEDLIQKCQSIDFDAILMDYHMDPNNGDYYIRTIRSEDSLTIVPIIFYSQDNTTDLKEKINGLNNIVIVYRPNLEDELRQRYFPND